MADAQPVKAGWFNGERSLAEQMLGLAPALETARGRHVLDLGCAEGLIALEFVRSGALSVEGYDNNGAFLEVAAREEKQLPAGLRGRACFEWRELNNWFVRLDRLDVAMRSYDVVLALAVLHKMHDPALCARLAADMAAELLVIRLPRDSDGRIEGKHTRKGCDLNKLLPTRGLALARVENGPRRERVQYWTRA